MGGAKNCPETPRQKMIGMMYLVLTAMLALNVAANILDGFTKINESFEASIGSTGVRTGNIMSAFKQAAGEEDGAKYLNWLEIANAVRKSSDELYEYVENFKQEMVGEAGWKEEDGVRKLAKPDDLNAASIYALTGGHGAELREKLNQFCKYMTSADSPCVQRKMKDTNFKATWAGKVNMYKTLFNTDDVSDKAHGTRKWEESLFEDMPLAASVAMLTKIQNDIRLAENDMVNFLFQTGAMGDITFSQFQAIILGDRGCYEVGQNASVKIRAAAVMDTTTSPTVLVNGNNVPNGVYHLSTANPGDFKYSGVIEIDARTKVPFEGSYRVIPATRVEVKQTPQKEAEKRLVGSAAISNEDLNVVYSGWSHKFKVSATGVSADKVHVTCSGGSMSGSNGVYTIVPGAAGGTMTIKVTGTVDGKTGDFGSQTFRIKPKPPVIVALRAGGGKVGKKLPRAGVPQCTISCTYAGDLLQSNFSVTGFSWELNGSGGHATSMSDPALLAAVKDARRGDGLVLSDFQITGNPTIANATLGFSLQ